MLNMPPVMTDIEVGLIDDEIKRDGYSIRRPENFGSLCEAAREEYLEIFRTAKLQPPKKKFSYVDLRDNPWRKLAIGSRNGVGEPYAQLLLATYFGVGDQSSGALNTIFVFMNNLRNRLMKVADDFGEDPARDKFWNACRVHHYPRGGGFMSMHRDTYFPIKLGDHPFYQVMVPLSVMGRDFVEGGGVIVTRQGEKLNTDEIGGLGSVILFDGRIEHAVEDVDPQEIMNFADPMGRLAAFSNLYVAQPAT